MILLLFGQLFEVVWFDCLLSVAWFVGAGLLVGLVSECFRFSWLGDVLFVVVSCFGSGCLWLLM